MNDKKRITVMHRRRLINTLKRLGALGLAMLGLGSALVSAAVVPGATPGAFAVNQNGAATYTVPIAVPPGLNGLQPQLALVYNSQQGNGLLGVGGALSGLSRIQRCPASLAVDGYLAGIDFSAARFCLDGQRLLPAGTGSDETGDYTAYRSELEGFARIRAYGEAAAPSHFTVWTPAGEVLTFGGSDTTHLAPQSRGTLIWSLARKEDRHGNALTVDYHTDHAAGEHYPLSVVYGGNEAAGVAAVRRVDWVMQPRPDPIVRYVAGRQVATTVRLQQVRVSFGNAPVRHYRLSYEAEPGAAQRSRWAAVQECGEDGETCWAPSELRWADGGGTTFTAGATVPLASGDTFGTWHRLVDANGDGLTDLFQVSDPASGTVHVGLAQAQGGYQFGPATAGVITPADEGLTHHNELADLNGDGFVDVLAVVTGEANPAPVRVVFGQAGGGFSAPVVIPDAAADAGNSFRFANQLIDMNGDGLLDIFRLKPGSTAFELRYGEVDAAGVYGLGAAVTPPGEGLASFDPRGAEGFRSTNQLADMNGDGLMDIVQLGERDAEGQRDAGVRVVFGTPEGGFEQQAGEQPEVLSPVSYPGSDYGGYFNFANQFVDVNGDGNLDIVRLGPPDLTNNQQEIGRITYCTGGGPFGQAGACQGEPNETIAYVNVFTAPTHAYDKVAVEVWLGQGDGRFREVAAATPPAVPLTGLSATPVKGRAPLDTRSCYADPAVTLERDTNRAGEWYYTVNTYRDCKAGGYVSQAMAYQGLTHWNQFADLNGDGYLDIVAAQASDGALSVAYGKGDGTFGTFADLNQAINIDGEQFRAFNQFSDLTGDGLVDLFIAHEGSAQVWASQRQPLNQVRTVRDGHDQVVHIDRYAPLSDPAVYTRSQVSSSYPVRPAQPPLHVVAQMSVQDGLSAPSFRYTTTYAYQGAQLDFTRGWLGFGRITRTDPDGLRTDTDYHTAFPFTGRPKAQRVSLAGDPTRALQHTAYRWGQRVEPAAGSRFVFEHGRTVQTFEPNTAAEEALSTVTTVYQDAQGGDNAPYDRYGQPQRVVVSTDDGHTQTTVVTAEYDDDNLFQGTRRAQTVRVSETTPAGTSATRTMATTFDVTTGRVLSETVEPDHALARTTTTTYTALGEVASETTEGLAAEYSETGTRQGGARQTRQAQLTYSPPDQRERTITATQAGLTTTTTVDQYWGLAVSEQDSAGVTTRRQADVLGRFAGETRYAGTPLAVTTTVHHEACDTRLCTRCPLPGAYRDPGHLAERGRGRRLGPYPAHHHLRHRQHHPPLPVH